MSHLDLVTILCKDIHKTTEFYVKFLGFSKVDEFSSPTGDFVWLRSDHMGSSIALQDARTRFVKPTLERIPVKSGGLMLGFPVDDASKVLEEWKTAGLETRTEMYDMKKGMTFGAFDPEGNYIQVFDVYPKFREIQRQLGFE